MLFLIIRSFIVYGLFAFLLWKLGKISAKREEIYYARGKQNVPFWTWEITFALLLFAIISGIRWQVGVDYFTYLDGYNDLLTSGSFRATRVEYGFEFISNIIASLNLHYSIYFGFWAFIQLFFIYNAAKNERYLLPFIGILIIWGPHYLSWMNGIRQMVAACMFVYSIQFIKDRKLIPYVITILFAATIHRSAVILLVFYFMPRKDFFKNRYLNIGLMIATLFIGMNPAWIQALDFVEKLLSFIGYEYYSENLDILVEKKVEVSIGPRRVSILLMNLIVVWYKPVIKNVFKNTNYILYFNLSFLGILLYNLFANSGHIFLRPVSYFTIFYILVLSYLLYYLKPNKDYKISIRFIIVFFVAVSYMVFSILAGAVSPENDFNNYKFFFFNDL
jgi:hypothetical protein